MCSGEERARGGACRGTARQSSGDATLHQSALHHPAPAVPAGEAGGRSGARAPEAADRLPAAEAQPARADRLHAAAHGRGQGHHVGGPLPCRPFPVALGRESAAGVRR